MARQHNTTQHNTTQHNTTQDKSTQHDTIQRRLHRSLENNVLLPYSIINISAY